MADHHITIGRRPDCTIQISSACLRCGQVGAYSRNRGPMLFILLASSHRSRYAGVMYAFKLWTFPFVLYVRTSGFTPNRHAIVIVLPWFIASSPMLPSYSGHQYCCFEIVLHNPDASPVSGSPQADVSMKLIYLQHFDRGFEGCVGPDCNATLGHCFLVCSTAYPFRVLSGHGNRTVTQQCQGQVFTSNYIIRLCIRRCWTAALRESLPNDSQLWRD
jgi:hypothetical protein